MAGSRIAQVKEAMKQIVETTLTVYDVCSLVVFNHAIKVVSRDVPLVDRRAELVQSIDGLVTSGATHFYDAVSDAIDIVRPAESATTFVVVLTDGEDQGSQRSMHTRSWSCISREF
jgi:hypothetical protein